MISATLRFVMYSESHISFALGFVVPFMAVYTPALMLQDGGPMAQAIGYWPAVAYIVLKAVISMGLWGAARWE